LLPRESGGWHRVHFLQFWLSGRTGDICCF
jgi:hypothetical protein